MRDYIQITVCVASRDASTVLVQEIVPVASSQNVWPLLYISVLCSWSKKSMSEIRVIRRHNCGRSTSEASRDFLDLEQVTQTPCRVHGSHTNLYKVPFAQCYSALSSSLLYTLARGRIGSSTKPVSAQDLTVQFCYEFTQIPVLFPQRSSAVGYCIISCFPLVTTQSCR